MVPRPPPIDRWLVFSDLDGTLLNHHDYNHAAALPMLRQLEQHGIPVIFNTSKTLAEMLDLTRRLGNRHPFIVENGSAIVIPDGYFPPAQIDQASGTTQNIPGHSVLVMGETLEKLQAFLDSVRPAAIDFTRCSLDQAIELTGLRPDEARLAQARGYSLPLAFESPAAETAFAAEAGEAGLRTLRGGRFLHLLGSCDKGLSLLRLKDLYRRQFSSAPGVIALGDSPNDLDMLQRADRAVVVDSPSSSRLQPDHPRCYRTRQSAPQGWVEGIEVSLFADTAGSSNLQEKFHG